MIDASKPLTDLLGKLDDILAGKCKNPEYDDMSHDGYVRCVYPDKEEGVVVVIFEDFEKEVIRCAKGDHFDVNVGVALAIAQHMYGSKTQFHKAVAKNTHENKKKAKAEPESAPKAKPAKKEKRK